MSGPAPTASPCGSVTVPPPAVVVVGSGSAAPATAAPARNARTRTPAVRMGARPRTAADLITAWARSIRGLEADLERAARAADGEADGLGGRVRAGAGGELVDRADRLVVEGDDDVAARHVAGGRR